MLRVSNAEFSLDYNNDNNNNIAFNRRTGSIKKSRIRGPGLVRRANAKKKKKK